MTISTTIQSLPIGVRLINIEDDYYNGPLAGHTQKEMAEIIGLAVLHEVDKAGMQIVWKKKD